MEWCLLYDLGLMGQEEMGLHYSTESWS